MLLARLALRNLLLQRVKTAIVGSILLLGTALVVLGTALIDAIDAGMKHSLVNSVAGHLQVYSDKAKDEFQLFGNFDGSMPDVDQIENFARVHRVLSQLPEVKTVVPMGIDFAVTHTDNILGRRLSALRDALRAGDKRRIGPLKRHIQRIIKVLAQELGNTAALIDVERLRATYGDFRKPLERALSSQFWTRFDSAPLDGLEFLENEIAPIALGEDVVWIRYLGTDTELFRKTFDRFEIVDGKMIPPGQRGFLFNKFIYEELLKNKTARRLDKIKQKIVEGRTIAACEDCRTWIGLNVKQAASLAYQMDDVAAAKVSAALVEHLGEDAAPTEGAPLVGLLKRFMRMDDSNFSRRHQLFYRAIAPHIVLYTVGIGDEFVLSGYSRSSGYQRRVPVKVYGTFRFRSLDRSPLAGGFNIVDIMTFRDLYGYMTDERRREQQSIRRAMDVAQVKREDAESLFDAPGPLTEVGDSSDFDPAAEVDLKAGGRRFTKEVHQRVYSRTDLWNGVVLNAAVMLEDGARLEQAAQAIGRANAKHQLGLQVRDWRKVSGTVGQLVMVITAVLYTSVAIIFVVALIIINNSLLMATIERTKEIGTMRAIGAQRGFVRRMFMFETGVLATVFGGLGALLGGALITYLGRVGIPAWTDFFYFLFAGPRLYPQLTVQHVGIALAVIAVVGTAATYYPARLATRITPREAMSGDE